MLGLKLDHVSKRGLRQQAIDLGDQDLWRHMASTLIQVMAYRQVITRTSADFVNWICRNKLQWKMDQNTAVFIEKVHLKLSIAKW